MQNADVGAMFYRTFIVQGRHSPSMIFAITSSSSRSVSPGKRNSGDGTDPAISSNSRSIMTYYVKDISPGLDAYIIFHTLKTMPQSRGAQSSAASLIRTGQKTTGMPGALTPLSLVETGGSLFQSPQYNNGTPLPALGGLPGLDQIGGGTPSRGGLVIQPDGPATTALLQGQAVQAITDNLRLVQSASMAATKSNANRRELTSLQLSPATLTS
jgi:hypothetical protein